MNCIFIKKKHFMKLYKISNIIINITIYVYSYTGYINILI